MKKKPGRPKTGAESIVIYVRVDKELVASLDEIGKSMSIAPDRTQLIKAAIREYVDRHGTQDRKPN